jgi:hypothetical protein
MPEKLLHQKIVAGKERDKKGTGGHEGCLGHAFLDRTSHEHHSCGETAGLPAGTVG